MERLKLFPYFILTYFVSNPCFKILADDPSSKPHHALGEVHVSGTSLLDTNALLDHPVDLAENQQSSLDDTLRSSPFLQISSWGRGKSLLATVRGTSTDHTTISMDGLEVMAPLDLGRFDFSRIMKDDFEQLVIEAGPSSQQNDSAPVGGNISLKTQQGKGPIKASGLAELGSLRSTRFHTRFSGEKEKTDFYLGVGMHKTGLTRQQNKLLGNFVGDEAMTHSATTNVGYLFSDKFEARLIASTSKHTTLVDRFRQGIPHFSHDRLLYRQTRISPQFLWMPSGDWTHELKLGYLYNKVINISPSFPYQNKSNNNSLSYGVQWNPSEKFFMSAGYYGYHESLKGPVSSSRTSNLQRLSSSVKMIPAERFIFLVKGISHHHSFSGTHVTQSVSLSWQALDNFAVYIKEGQGIKFPNLIDLYGLPPVQMPNKKLHPEKSQTFEGGIKVKCIRWKTSGQISFFHTKIKNLIGSERASEGVYTTLNQGERTLQGLEAGLTLTPVNDLTIKTIYSYTRSRPSDQFRVPIRVARHKVQTSFSYRPTKESSAFIEATFKSRRKDYDFGTVPRRVVDLGAYTLFRAGLQYDINENFRLYGRMENIFNATYEDVFGYGARGREILIGLRLQT